MADKKYPLGLNKAEYDNLLQIIRYGCIIVITVLITFTVVAGATRLFGYAPPPPANSLLGTPASPE